MTSWDSSLETGDAMIDWQHRELFAIVDDLRSARDGDDAESRVDLLLDRMLLYASNHFSAEENLMESVGYDLAEALSHRADHIALKEHVDNLVGRRRCGELRTIGPVALFLEQWLSVHIKQVDRKLIDFARGMVER